MPGRQYSETNSQGYRFGFNGKEKDNEVKGDGNLIDYGEREYDPRLAKWFSLDPLRQIYTSLSPYSFGANNPINILDANGKILRDKNGNIIATDRGTTSERTIAKSGSSSIVVKYKDVTIYTDKGNPVQAQIAIGFVKRTAEGDKTTETEISSKNIGELTATSESVKSNCHGYVFADNNIVLNAGIKNILNDEYTNIGVVNDGHPNPNLEAQADVVAIYGIAGIFTSQDKFDEDSWNHTGKKQDGKWTDKDDWTQSRKDLNTTADVRDSPLEMDPSTDKDRVLYKKINKEDKKVESLPEVGKQPNGIRIVSQEDIKKIQNDIKQNDSKKGG